MSGALNTFELPDEKGIDVKTYGQKAVKGSLSVSEQEYGVKNFNLTFGSVYGDTQKNLMNEAGIDEFDLIFIDGKSVKECLGQKASELTPEETLTHMKCMVIGAMTDADKKIEICSLEKVKGIIKPKDEMRSVSADIKLREEKAKPRTFGEKLWNLLGRWKAPETQAEKAKKLYEKDREKPVRKALVLNYLGGRIKEMQPIKKLHEKCKAASDKFDRINTHNDKQFTGFLEEGGKVLNPEEVNRFFGGTEVISGNNCRPDSRRAMIGLYALSRGLSMEGLCSDDPKYDADKRKYGKDYYDMLKKASMDVKEAMSTAEDGIENKLQAKENAKKASPAVKAVRDAFLKMGDSLYEMQIPVSDMTDRNQLIDKFTELRTITGFGMDYEYNFNNLNQHLTEEQAQNNEFNCDVGQIIIRTGGALTDFVSFAAKAGFGDKYIGDAGDMAKVLASLETLPLVKDFYKDCEDFSDAKFTDKINEERDPHSDKFMEFTTMKKGALAKMLCEHTKFLEKGETPEGPHREKSSVNEITKELFDVKDYSDIVEDSGSITKKLLKENDTSRKM